MKTPRQELKENLKNQFVLWYNSFVCGDKGKVNIGKTFYLCVFVAPYMNRVVRYKPL